MEICVPELPFPLSRSPAPESWAYKKGVLTVAAGPRTDLFTSPEDGSVRAEAPLLLGSYRSSRRSSPRPSGPLSTRVR
jgi:hypothetical protein